MLKFYPLALRRYPYGKGIPQTVPLFAKMPFAAEAEPYIFYIFLSPVHNLSASA